MSVAPAAPATATGAPVAVGSTPLLRSAATSLGAATEALAIALHVQGGFSGARTPTPPRCPLSRTGGPGCRSCCGCIFCLVPLTSLDRGSSGGCGSCCVSCGGPCSGPCACPCSWGGSGLRFGLCSCFWRGPVIAFWRIASSPCCVRCADGLGHGCCCGHPLLASPGWGLGPAALRRLLAGSARTPMVCCSSGGRLPAPPLPPCKLSRCVPSCHNRYTARSSR